MESLNHFSEFVKEISANNSRLYKQDILKKYQYDEVIKYYLNYIYNPYIITGISSKKIAKFTGDVEFGLFDELVEFTSVKEVLEYVRVNHTGTDAILKGIAKFKAAHKVDGNLVLFDDIITKSLTLGVDAKTINFIIPSLIPTFDVQLANKYFDNPKIVEGKIFALTTKIDGGRIIAIKDYDGTVCFFTRAGQRYEGLVDLEKELAEKAPNGTVLDGEITLLDKGNLTSKEQYKETMKITRKDGEKHGVKMLVFDCIPIEEWKAQVGKTSYKARRTRLEALFASGEYLQGAKYFELLDVLYEGQDASEITKWLNHNIAAGEEGICINLVDEPYHFCRSNALLKVKKMQDMDLRIVGFEEGTGRLAGTLGALLVKYKDSNLVKVGSGFSDSIRQEIWQNQDKYINTICAVQYFEETTNQNGGASLRFPIFIDFRPDLLETLYD